MDQKDVVIGAFSIPPKSSDRAIALPFGDWADPPVVIGVDPDFSKGASSDAGAFGQAADNYRDSDGFILRRIIRERLTGIEVRRIALVGFSAGCAFVSKVLRGADAAHLDVVLALDGVHIQRNCRACPFIGQSLSPWVNFGVSAARGAINGDGPLMVITHTHIRQPLANEEQVGNTDESAAAVTAQVVSNAADAPRIGFDPDLLSAPPPPPPVTITVDRPIGPGQSVPITRHWDAMPLPDVHGKGNYFTLDYGGDGEADHVFQARYVQGAVWRSFIGPRWQAALACPPGSESEATQGGCAGGGVIVPSGLYATDESPHWGWAAAGFVLGTVVGVKAGIDLWQKPRRPNRRRQSSRWM